MDRNTEPTFVLGFDLEEAQKQIKALQYNNHEMVFLRAFYPQCDPRHKTVLKGGAND